MISYKVHSASTTIVIYQGRALVLKIRQEKKQQKIIPSLLLKVNITDVMRLLCLTKYNTDTYSTLQSIKR